MNRHKSSKGPDGDEQYTPKSIFEALACAFDMDVASPVDRTYCCVPAQEFITSDSLLKEWSGFVWCNPPYANVVNKRLWLNKMSDHANGIALLPDRTSTLWWHEASYKCDGLLFVQEKIKFVRPDGSIGKQPSNGSTLFAYGQKATDILQRIDGTFGRFFKTR